MLSPNLQHNTRQLKTVTLMGMIKSIFNFKGAAVPKKAESLYQTTRGHNSEEELGNPSKPRIIDFNLLKLFLGGFC